MRRPALRYHGGKWLLAPWIISHFPPHRIYVESFGGAASVLLQKPRSYSEVYNELDPEIVNVFRVQRDNGIELRKKLSLTPFSRVEFNKAYESTDCDIERARRTIIKSFMGFGSNGIHQPTGFRSNSKRSGTTPAHDWVNYTDRLDQIIARLQGVVIENNDALNVIQNQDSDQTLHYVDPPYVRDTRNPGHDYRFEMTDEQHAHLAIILHRIEGMVIISGYKSDLYKRLYYDWKIVSRPALADGARKRTECLWISPSAEQHTLKL